MRTRSKLYLKFKIKNTVWGAYPSVPMQIYINHLKSKYFSCKKKKSNDNQQAVENNQILTTIFFPIYSISIAYFRRHTITMH